MGPNNPRRTEATLGMAVPPIDAPAGAGGGQVFRTGPRGVPGPATVRFSPVVAEGFARGGSACGPPGGPRDARADGAPAAVAEHDQDTPGSRRLGAGGVAGW